MSMGAVVLACKQSISQPSHLRHIIQEKPVVLPCQHLGFYVVQKCVCVHACMFQDNDTLSSADLRDPNTKIASDISRMETYYACMHTGVKCEETMQSNPDFNKTPT